MDLTASIIPKSDQINADDLMAGPITATIEDVRSGSAEQPVDVILKEYPGRAYRPSKSMRRVLVSAWGKEGADYIGKRLTLFRNPDIAFGGIKLGGVEIAAMSDLEKPLTVALTTTRSKRKNFTVKPLTEAPSSPNATLSDEDTATWVDLLTNSTTLEELQRNWGLAAREHVTDDARILAAKDKRKGELS